MSRRVKTCLLSRALADQLLLFAAVGAGMCAGVADGAAVDIGARVAVRGRIPWSGIVRRPDLDDAPSHVFGFNILRFHKQGHPRPVAYERKLTWEKAVILGDVVGLAQNDTLSAVIIEWWNPNGDTVNFGGGPTLPTRYIALVSCTESPMWSNGVSSIRRIAIPAVFEQEPKRRRLFDTIDAESSAVGDDAGPLPVELVEKWARQSLPVARAYMKTRYARPWQPMIPRVCPMCRIHTADVDLSFSQCRPPSQSPKVINVVCEKCCRQMPQSQCATCRTEVVPVFITYLGQSPQEIRREARLHLWRHFLFGTFATLSVSIIDMCEIIFACLDV